eukprot:3189509-Prymnesium_polylepis.1
MQRVGGERPGERGNAWGAKRRVCRGRVVGWARLLLGCCADLAALPAPTRPRHVGSDMVPCHASYVSGRGTAGLSLAHDWRAPGTSAFPPAPSQAGTS